MTKEEFLQAYILTRIGNPAIHARGPDIRGMIEDALLAYKLIKEN